jgi:amidase
VLVADDAEPRGDFWRVQPWVPIPKASALRPPGYARLVLEGSLRGKRLGAPRMYIGTDAGADQPIETRPSVLVLWREAVRDLEALGATVVEVDFPVISNYERDRPGARSMVDRGLVPKDFAECEKWDLRIWAWDDFLRANADPAIPDLASVDGPKIFPQPAGALPDRYSNRALDHSEYVERAKQRVTPLADIPTIEEGVKGLEETRRLDFEEWLRANGLDAVVLPAVADVGPADADVNEASAALAWRNGTWVANGNRVWRHLGIPTLTVPMGNMADIGMPVGLTFAGMAYDDVALLCLAGDYERATQHRVAPPRTPALADDVFTSAEAGPRTGSASEGPDAAPITLALRAETTHSGDTHEISIALEIGAGDAAVPEAAVVKVHANGEPVRMESRGNRYTGQVVVPASTHQGFHSVWRASYGSIVTAIVRLTDGRSVGAYAVTGGIE